MTRQELYDKIKLTSKDSFILEEMKRLGFWDSNKPKLAKEMIEQKVALQKELNTFSKKIKDPKSALKDIHKQRMKEAMDRREETKKAREKKQENIKQQREIKKDNEVGFIGYSFIKDLNNKTSNNELLKQNNLFEIKDTKELADKMGVDIGLLKRLTYTQKLSTSSNYVSFKIPKKTGGFRDISAPKEKLKELQQWIVVNILNKVPINENAHGFVAKKSILTNATPHIQKQVVINCDLENFFPTLTYPRVKGLFNSLGYSMEISVILALLTTQAEQKEIILDEERYYLYTNKRYLPQGSPASPMITNIMCRKLDNRLKGISKSLNFEYSRYADDMTFSSQEYLNITKMLHWVKYITKEEGFTLHPDKTQIMRKGSRQEVTGIVVNQKPSINKKTLKQFRALLYQINQDGLEGKQWQGNSDNLLDRILGYAHFINMVDKTKGQKYLSQIEDIIKIYAPKDKSYSNKILDFFKK